MRWSSTAVALTAALCLSSCGYVGAPVPPSPEIPSSINDLTVVERGNQLLIQFTTPSRTTDNALIPRFSHLEVDVGPESSPFDLASWLKTAHPYSIPIAPSSAAAEGRIMPVDYALPATEWESKRIAVMVRSSVKKNDHFSDWSNRITLSVVPPLKPPDVSAQPTAAGYKLTWPDEGSGLHFNVFRQAGSDTQPVQIGTTETNDYVDTGSQWDTPYTYTVIAGKEHVESDASKPVHVNASDTFPPTVPTELSAFASTDAIEVSWQRSPESDLAGYFVYRSENGATFAKVGGAVLVPAYTDKQVEHGKSYRYQVSAVDRKGNESEKSSPVEVAFP